MNVVIFATRCKLKNIKIISGLVFAPNPTGGAYRSSPLSSFPALNFSPSGLASLQLRASNFILLNEGPSEL